MYMEIFMAILIGYLFGSIPFALVIGKIFYKKDIRQYGSKNLGGGNAGRVLGKKAGLAVMTLDILKVSFAVFLAGFFKNNEITTVLAGLAAALGHCFPLFAQFKGGKAVATMYGFLFGMAVFGEYTLLLFFMPLTVFLIVLYIWKIISLASMCSAVVITGYMFWKEGISMMSAALMIFTVLIIVRHRMNIGRIARGEEKKITWM